jgi:hypothetical protein
MGIDQKEAAKLEAAIRGKARKPEAWVPEVQGAGLPGRRRRRTDGWPSKIVSATVSSSNASTAVAATLTLKTAVLKAETKSYLPDLQRPSSGRCIDQP